MPIKKLRPTKKTSAKRAKPAAWMNANQSLPEVHHHYYPIKPRNFNFGKLSLGLFLVVIGILYLAKNLGWLNIDFNFNLWQLWPLLIVFWGLSLLTGRTIASIFAGIILTLTVLAITFILVLGATDAQINVSTSPAVPAASPTVNPDATLPVSP